MRVSIRPSIASRLAGAVGAIWLCGVAPAWAGGGSGDLGSVQAALDTLCDFLGMTSCPQLPTITQVVLEVSALENVPPDSVRSGSSFAICNVAGIGLPRCDTVAINAINSPASSSITLSDGLTPLAFVIKKGQAVPTQPGDPSATGFFYAAATSASGQPDTLTLFYDYPPLTSSNFAKGQIVGKISLPLQVLSKTDGSESFVATTLQITATCAGGPACLTAYAVGGIGSPQNPIAAASLGVKFVPSFGPSPNSGRAHAIFEFQVPLLVTGPTKPAQCGKAILSGKVDPTDCGNDPAYFGVDASGDNKTGSPTGINQSSGLPTAFSTNDLGFTPSFLGAPVGIAPYAAPPCPLGAPCSVPPPSSAFPFCASFSANGSNTLRPAVAAFLAIGTDATNYVSAPVASSAQVQCPF